jgi:hypothetical protein
MATQTKLVIDAADGSVEVVPLTADDIAQYAADAQVVADNELLKAQAAKDKAALLAKLGITADEAALLLG